MQIIAFLKGKKTYIVAALMIVLGLLQGDNQLILEGLGILTLRAGIKKTENAIAGARVPSHQ